MLAPNRGSERGAHRETWAVFQRFTSLDALKGIGRDLLVRFLDPFEAELAASHIKLTAACLARHLSAFGVHPKLFRIGSGRGKGYELADFTQAFHQFLPPPDSNGHS